MFEGWAIEEVGLDGRKATWRLYRGSTKSPETMHPIRMTWEPVRPRFDWFRVSSKVWNLGSRLIWATSEFPSFRVYPIGDPRCVSALERVDTGRRRSPGKKTPWKNSEVGCVCVCKLLLLLLLTSFRVSTGPNSGKTLENSEPIPSLPGPRKKFAAAQKFWRLRRAFRNEVVAKKDRSPVTSSPPSGERPQGIGAAQTLYQDRVQVNEVLPDARPRGDASTVIPFSDSSRARSIVIQPSRRFASVGKTGNFLTSLSTPDWIRTSNLRFP